MRCSLEVIMEKEKLEIPVELDAKIMQYAAEKKFIQHRWYWSVPARAAAILLFGAAAVFFHFSDREHSPKDNLPLAENSIEIPDWNDFEQKMEFIDEEIFIEARYLAQL